VKLHVGMEMQFYECDSQIDIFYSVVRTEHFGMKLYNDQCNAQVLIYLSLYFCLTCFGLSFSSIMAQTLTPYPGDLNHCRSCTPASDNGLKESPKHVRQK
jgi:hypothetical protein